MLVEYRSGDGRDDVEGGDLLDDRLGGDVGRWPGSGWRSSTSRPRRRGGRRARRPIGGVTCGRSSPRGGQPRRGTGRRRRGTGRRPRPTRRRTTRRPAGTASARPGRRDRGPPAAPLDAWSGIRRLSAASWASSPLAAAWQLVIPAAASRAFLSLLLLLSSSSSSSLLFLSALTRAFPTLGGLTTRSAGIHSSILRFSVR